MDPSVLVGCALRISELRLAFALNSSRSTPCWAATTMNARRHSCLAQSSANMMLYVVLATATPSPPWSSEATLREPKPMVMVGATSSPSASSDTSFRASRAITESFGIILAYPSSVDCRYLSRAARASSCSCSSIASRLARSSLVSLVSVMRARCSSNLRRSSRSMPSQSMGIAQCRTSSLAMMSSSSVSSSTRLSRELPDSRSTCV
mmetsp:Transcript_24990/g.80518  ORF Transcript_24990/g.80518 Transcript_24990/m.80518 type:complete len:207 (+) Transcript_24990:93-713(+)